MSRKIKNIEYVGRLEWIEVVVSCEDESLWIFLEDHWRRLPNIPDDKEDNKYLKERIGKLEKVLKMLGTRKSRENQFSKCYDSSSFIIKELNIAKDKLEKK